MLAIIAVGLFAAVPSERAV
ncbi:hypothetical protein IC232_20170 [Microvirga sp. BT688]|nr:hypothetical protein [Microvirga sp.]